MAGGARSPALAPDRYLTQVAPPPPLQVTLLSQGRLMYHGPTEGLQDWFGRLGYAYDPDR